jgi:hypothetical protein
LIHHGCTWLAPSGLGSDAWRLGGPSWLQPPPADPGRSDAHVNVPGSGRPRLEARSFFKALHGTLICDFVRVAMHQDAPALTERMIEVIYLEADLPIAVESQERVRGRAEDDRFSGHGEVDRQHHDPICGCEPDAADSARLQQVEAFGGAERPQGVATGSGLGRLGPPVGQGTQRVLAVRRFLPGCHMYSRPFIRKLCRFFSLVMRRAPTLRPDVPHGWAIRPFRLAYDVNTPRVPGEVTKFNMATISVGFMIASILQQPSGGVATGSGVGFVAHMIGGQPFLMPVPARLPDANSPRSSTGGKL